MKTLLLLSVLVVASFAQCTGSNDPTQDEYKNRVKLAVGIVEGSTEKNGVRSFKGIYRSQQVREILADWSKNPDANEISIHGKEKAILLHKQFTYFSQLYGDPSFTPDVLSTIGAETLIIHGDNDQLAPTISNALGMYQNIPNSYLWIVPNGGHLPLPPYLDPKNESDFVKRTIEFLNGDWDKK